jgi:hypothetical protein
VSGDARYPLAAARTLRAREEDAAREALAAAIDALRAAEDAHAHAEARCVAHRAETARIGAAEADADTAGRSLAESLRAADWQRRRRIEDAALRSARDDAERARQAAATAVEAARATLAAARAAREAVERHFAAWQDEARRDAERRAETEAEDVQAGRRGRSG